MRPLSGIQNQWHSINLPDDIYSKTNKAFSDIRIYGITKNNDTIEAPYIMKTLEERSLTTFTNAVIINQSHKGDIYFYTFDNPEASKISQLKLEFGQKNYDWRVNVEGSDDAKEWFSVLENYRIVSVKNEFTDYSFSTLHFPAVQYKFLRINIKSTEQPKLLSTIISDVNIFKPGTYRSYKPFKINTVNNSESKETIIDIDFGKVIPAGKLALHVSDKIDFYRPISIEYLSDSFQTPKGWQYNYLPLSSGTLTSLEKPVYALDNTLLRNLRITIQNHDNQPLKIDSVILQSAVHQLTARFTEEADYYLVYGNKNASAPNYDISNFSEKIPKELSLLEIGEEKAVSSKPEKSGKPNYYFRNKLWLWAIMGVIILVLGWFTLKMIKTGSAEV
jgi:hypothetical protein